METLSNKANAQVERIKAKDPDLFKEYEQKRKATQRTIIPTDEGHERVIAEAPHVIVAPDIATISQGRTEEAIALAHLRPVLIIRDNKIVPEFVGPDVQIWKDRLMEKESVLNSVIPSVGRVEVSNNAIYKWVGTGWMIDTDIIITNRHVASLFAQNREGFAFKTGYPSGMQAANMDFLEEDQRTTSFEFAIESVLWIAENDDDQPDVAFMRVKRTLNGPPLPKPIPLADSTSEGDVVVTIGYPARDPDVPDQEMVLRIFGNVYDKKRLAPGEILNVNGTELEHDCSTLGGNSGSAVIQLSTGKAVGLHFAGLYLQGNFAVPSGKIKELLDNLRQGTLPRMRGILTTNETATSSSNFLTPSIMNNSRPGVYSIEANIPVKVTLEIGGSVVSGSLQGPPSVPSLPVTATSQQGNYEEAIEAAKQALNGQPGIISVGRGYRFKRGWITDEKVVVVEVQEKQNLPQLRSAGKQLIPQEFLGYGVHIRTAGLPEQLSFLGIDMAGLEAPAHPGVYREPPNLSLDPVNENMKAIFHVSPDSGWPNLKAFFGRIEGKLTATMYEWEAEHISKSLFDAINNVGGQLTMVTQKPGTKDAVKEMQDKLGAKFDHVWASVGGGKIVPSAYHIKVASRDEKEFWLSSGNWKKSNQDEIDPAGENSTAITPLRQHNREWHAIIEHAGLAKLFEDYIKWDFQEAQRVPLEEAIAASDIFLFIPETAFAPIPEARVIARYFDPLVLDRKINIQPLLTPDRNSRGQRIFMDFAVKLIQSARATIDIENQSFNLLDDNQQQFEKLFTVLKNKQDAGVAVRIIFRDPREFSATKGKVSLQKLLDRIKDFGLDTDNIKVQVAVTPRRLSLILRMITMRGIVRSHNLTNEGSLFNRDASLLIKDAEIARYFQPIFNFDWEVLATQTAEESVGGIRVAGANEVTPIGFRKVSLAEFYGRGVII